MAVQFVHGITKYCSRLNGQCSADRDSKIYFDKNLNLDTGLKFPDYYDAALTDILQGAATLELGLTFQTVGIVIASCCMWIGWFLLRDRAPSFRRLRYVTGIAAVLSIGACLSGLAGVSIFLKKHHFTMSI